MCHHCLPRVFFFLLFFTHFTVPFLSLSLSLYDLGPAVTPTIDQNNVHLEKDLSSAVASLAFGELIYLSITKSDV